MEAVERPAKFRLSLQLFAEELGDARALKQIGETGNSILTPFAFGNGRQLQVDAATARTAGDGLKTHVVGHAHTGFGAAAGVGRAQLLLAAVDDRVDPPVGQRHEHVALHPVEAVESANLTVQEERWDIVEVAIDLEAEDTDGPLAFVLLLEHLKRDQVVEQRRGFIPQVSIGQVRERLFQGLVVDGRHSGLQISQIGRICQLSRAGGRRSPAKRSAMARNSYYWCRIPGRGAAPVRTNWPCKSPRDGCANRDHGPRS